ncbi:MAG: hypothetical protein QOI25_4190 [Mycobacterium sp.]|jgi:hypothetical protein|nr:hypothetical protein [Mycobacterium sp.]
MAHSVEKQAASRRACGIYGTVILAFARGSVDRRLRQPCLGRTRDLAGGGILAVTLVLFIVDERVLR